MHVSDVRRNYRIVNVVIEGRTRSAVKLHFNTGEVTFRHYSPSECSLTQRQCCEIISVQGLITVTLKSCAKNRETRDPRRKGSKNCT